MKAEFKNTCMQMYDIQKKKKTGHQLDLDPQSLECKSVALPIEVLLLWFFDEMLLEFSPLFHLQPAAERKLTTALTCYE